MASASPRPYLATGLHPLHAVLLAGTVPLFLGGLLSDLRYAASPEPQWNNFAAWLIAAGMVFAGFTLLWSLIALVRGPQRPTWLLVSFLVLGVGFVLGLVDSLVHARDAWGVMPAGPILSAIVAVLAIIATWIGFSSLRRGERP